MIAILYILVGISFVIIITLAAVKAGTRADDPVGVVIRWIKNRRTSVAKAKSEMRTHPATGRGASNPNRQPLRRFRLKKQGVVKCVTGAKFILGHPDIKRPHYVRVCLTNTHLVLYGWFYFKKYASVPLARITDIKIEKRHQIRERFAAKHPLVGVAEEYFEGNSKKREYFLAVRWQDQRALKHDLVLRIILLASVHRWIRINNIRLKILAAKPSLDDPAYGIPKDAKRLLAQEKELESRMIDTDIEIDDDEQKRSDSSKKHSAGDFF
jgi:hypothetical protein